MIDKIYRDFYKQDFLLLNSVLGMDLRTLQFNRGSINLGKEQILSGVGNLGINFFDRETNESKSISFVPKGGDSIGGDIYGFEFYQEEESYSGQILYQEYFKLESLIFYGEEKEEEIDDIQRINWAYKNREQKPDKVIVKKKTIDIIQFKISQYRNCYLYCGGEKDFSMSLNSPLEHDSWLMLQRENYKAMEKELKELKRIS